MFRKYLSAAALAPLGAAMLAAPSHAQESDDGRDYVRVGAGAAFYRAPFEDADTQVFPLPILSVREDFFYIEGDELGAVYDLGDGDFTPSVQAFVSARFRPGQDREKLSADAGARFSLTSKVGTISVEYQHDVTDTFNGGEATARYSYPISMGRFTLVPALQATWMDSDTTNYMYGITEAQRLEMIENGRDTILPVSQIDDDAINLGGDITATYALSDRITAFAFLSGTYLDESIRDSAAVDQEWESNAAIGLTYQF